MESLKIYNDNKRQFLLRFTKIDYKIANKFKIKLIGFDGQIKQIYDMPMGHLRDKSIMGGYQKIKFKRS